MTKINPTPNVSGKYGAPMGRMSHNSYTDKQGRTFEITVNENAGPFRLIRCPLDSGGYDRGGAYWGLGAPLYYYEGPLSDISGYVRGKTREAAKAAVRETHPKARFYNMTAKTNRDIETNLWGSRVTIPKGTPVHFVSGIGGGWVVSSSKLLVELTGNTHDPKYRYAWISEADVDKEPVS